MLCLYNYNGSATGNVYGAVIMIVAIARVRLVDLMNADRGPGGRQSSNQAYLLGR